MNGRKNCPFWKRNTRKKDNVSREVKILNSVLCMIVRLSGEQNFYTEDVHF